ncbi:MAG: polysaccharide biosynthesis/export family protein [Planctomycetaceae bacterium]
MATIFNHPATGCSTRIRPNAAVWLVASALLTASAGCSQFALNAIPVSRVPSQILAGELKDDFEDISPLRLRQDPPEAYLLAPGDVLGFHIYEQAAAVAAAQTSAARQSNVPLLPAVHFSEDGSLPPAVGNPIVVQDNGTIAVPILSPIHVEGLSLVQATEKVRNAYTVDTDTFPDDTQFSLTMIHRRTVRVQVIREESGGKADITKRGTGHIVDLPAYENDVLHALSETGGMPGTDAKNEVLIYRGMFNEAISYDQVLNGICVDNCQDPCFCNEAPLPDPPNLTRIPLRYNPANPPVFSQDQILLHDGDIVIIRSRDEETFLTAGLLGGGEYPLPRDKDLDVLGAIAIAGGPLGNFGTGIGGVGGGARGRGFGGTANRGGGGYCQPSEVIVIRELPCGNQITIKVDLNKALEDRSQRILIKPNDVVMLRYTLTEEIGNVVLNLIQFNYFLNSIGR